MLLSSEKILAPKLKIDEFVVRKGRRKEKSWIVASFDARMPPVTRVTCSQ